MEQELIVATEEKSKRRNKKFAINIGRVPRPFFASVPAITSSRLGGPDFLISQLQVTTEADRGQQKYSERPAESVLGSPVGSRLHTS
jgi:hypothetical protein